jgi:DNA-binding XRE family transcriptional regulator
VNLIQLTLELLEIRQSRIAAMHVLRDLQQGTAADQIVEQLRQVDACDEKARDLRLRYFQQSARAFLPSSVTPQKRK